MNDAIKRATAVMLRSMYNGETPRDNARAAILAFLDAPEVREVMASAIAESEGRPEGNYKGTATDALSALRAAAGGEG